MLHHRILCAFLAASVFINALLGIWCFALRGQVALLEASLSDQRLYNDATMSLCNAESRVAGGCMRAMNSLLDGLGLQNSAAKKFVAEYQGIPGAGAKPAIGGE
jgi:hypothetical protein